VYKRRQYKKQHF